jgi:hypothetical protein
MWFTWYVRDAFVCFIRTPPPAHASCPIHLPSHGNATRPSVRSNLADCDHNRLSYVLAIRLNVCPEHDQAPPRLDYAALHILSIDCTLWVTVSTCCLKGLHANEPPHTTRSTDSTMTRNTIVRSLTKLPFLQRRADLCVLAVRSCLIVAVPLARSIDNTTTMTTHVETARSSAPRIARQATQPQTTKGGRRGSGHAIVWRHGIDARSPSWATDHSDKSR